MLFSLHGEVKHCETATTVVYECFNVKFSFKYFRREKEPLVLCLKKRK